MKLVPLLFLCVVAEALMAGCNFILVAWTDQISLLHDQGEILSLQDQKYYLRFYGILIVGQFFVSLTFNIWGYVMMTKVSLHLHKKLLNSIMHVPLSFFEENPSGRIINRFTSDMETIDRSIPLAMCDVFWCSVNILSVIVIVSVIVPYILIFLVPLSLIFIALQVGITRAQCQTKRFESVAKSPILSLFSEVINGSMTIRALRQEERFLGELEQKTEAHLRHNYTCEMCNRSVNPQQQ